MKIRLRINDRAVELTRPMSVLEAARLSGIHIPHLCSHPLLEPWGGCRLCLVEVERMPKLQTACTLEAADGMVIRTETPEIARARRAMLEFLLINHPLECAICDKAGECKLQDYTVRYGAAQGRFQEGKRTHPENIDDPLIVRNMQRCILCTRCVRMCSAVQGAHAIAVTGRGARSYVEPFSGGRYNCEYCGNCLTVCPVGAIMSRLHRYSFRPWLMERQVQSLCPFCGVGCKVEVQLRGEELMRVLPGRGVNKGLLCSRGRFGYGYINSPRRLRGPLVREGETLREASWHEALELTARRLQQIRERHGAQAVGAVASARCSLEEAYLLQKLLRAALGSNNIDSIARLGLAGTQALLEALLGPGATANLMEGVARSEAVLVVGPDPTRANPVLGLKVREAYRRGARVLTLGYVPGLRWHRHLALRPRAGGEAHALAALLAALLEERGLSGESPEIEETIRGWHLPGLGEALGASGLKEEALEEAVGLLKEARTAAVILNPGLVMLPNGAQAVLLSGALSYVLNARVLLSSERPNEQGLLEAGCAPELLPGARPLEVESFRAHAEEHWGRAIPPEPGLTLMEMLQAARAGTLKALYVMGENPLFNLPDRPLLQEALGALEFLVLQDAFLTETAEQYAHVVLPGRPWGGKQGVFVNLERRAQLMEAFLPGGMQDWQVLCELLRRLGLGAPYEGPADVLEEIACVSPLHAGLTYEELRKAPLWPYKGEALRSRPRRLHLGQLGEPPQGLQIVPEVLLHHSGSSTQHSEALMSIQSVPTVGLAPSEARRLGLEDGQMARISTVRGSLALRVRLEEEAPPGALLMSNHLRGAGALGLLGFELEPLSKAPALKTELLEVSPL